MVIDPYGVVIAQANGTMEQLVMGDIDVMWLRERRKMFRGRGSGNAVSATRTELFRPWYDKTIFPPNETIKHGPMKHVNDELVARRRTQALENVLKGYDFYSENDVK